MTQDAGKRRIIVVGGGFAGLWAAAAAARARELFGLTPAALDIALVAPDPFHTIRVRCYEDDLAAIRLPLDDLLAPMGVTRVEAAVTTIAPAARSLATGAGTLAYDRLILAAGSKLTMPSVPCAQPTFDVDSYAGAERLAAHLASLAAGPRDAAAGTAVVIGGGLAGVEIACELPGRLRALLGDGDPVRVVLVDHGEIGAAMGAGAVTVRDAVAACGVEIRDHSGIAAVEADGVRLTDGTSIPARTVLFTTGAHASPLASQLGVPLDRLGRVAVDAFLKVEGVADIYAAGDCAVAAADDLGHVTVMSCQHARPMGRLAGHNAVCDLAGRFQDRVAFSAPDYVTVMDLGPEGAVYTSGWDRATLVASGAEAKTVKQTINCSRIYPPVPATKDALFAAAAPVLQARPAAK